MLVALALLAVGFPLIAVAADHFVTGASRLSSMLGISPIVVGAVVVGFGTSAPEAVVAALAVVRGATDLGVGQVLGSNIANLALVLGAAALVTPLHILRTTIRREYALSAGACVLFVVLAGTDSLSFVTGLVLLALLGAALLVVVRWGHATPDAVVAEVMHHQRDQPGPGGSAGGQAGAEGRAREVARTFVAMVAVVVAAQFLVDGATTVATELGVSEAVLGFTLVAFGTSLPELVTAVSAARRGHTDLIVGNVLGSNLFNSLGVGGVIGLAGAAPLADPTVAIRSGAALLALLVFVAVLMRTSPGILRWEGAVLVVVYLAVVVALFV
ncbi:MAG: calcium/sodium antiporter [Acidimicrobiia bacterium]|nr:calcium/sodium antiporter [Acidimicrobiia bacterium]